LPQPGYPLFEGILAPLGITPRWYRCRPERDFLPDPQEISSALTHASPHEPVTAVVVISPNNPCGVTYPAGLMHEIAAVCHAAGVALIVDEVFSGLADSRTAAWHPGSGAPVTFVLNGLSKLAAAPDVKLGWIVVDGGEETHRLVDELDTTHDTYLTVSGFASAAPHSFLVGGEAEEFRRVIRERVSQTRGELQRALAALPGWEPAPATSGIHLPVRISPHTAEALWGTTDDEEIAIALLRDHNIYLHPGYFYSLDEETVGSGPWLVVTALHAPGTVAAAVRRLRSLHS
jgi:aspartate/methionine/tyrosine aminotransferase